MWNPSKKKLINGALIGGLLVVWGWIVFSLIGSNAEEGLSQAEAWEVPIRNEDGEDTHSYVPRYDYDDPFLGTLKQTRAAKAGRKVATAKTSSVRPPARVLWPEVAYFGVVKNKDKGNSLALLSLNGKSHLVYDNQVLQDITVKAYNSDSIVLSMAGTTKAFNTHSY